MVIAKQYIFQGRVQGVGFRYATKQLAKGFDVTGWVRNREDRTVELQVMGEEEGINDFLSELRDSFVGQFITEQTERRIPLLQNVTGFSIQ